MSEYSETAQLKCDFHYSPSASSKPTLETPVRDALFRLGSNENDRAKAKKLKDAVEPAIALDSLAKCSIRIHILVLDSEGGELAAAVMAASLALVHAGIPMKGLVSACSVSLPTPESVDGAHNVTWMDPTDKEAAGCQSTVTLAIVSGGGQEGISLIDQMGRQEVPTLMAMMSQAHEGCRLVQKALEGWIQSAMTTAASLEQAQMEE